MLAAIDLDAIHSSGGFHHPPQWLIALGILSVVTMIAFLVYAGYTVGGVLLGNRFQPGQFVYHSYTGLVYVVVRTDPDGIVVVSCLSSGRISRVLPLHLEALPRVGECVYHGGDEHTIVSQNENITGMVRVGSGAARVELQTQDIRPSMRRQRLLPPLFEEDSASDESTDESEDSSAEQTDSCDSGESSSSGDDNDQLGDDRSMSPFLV